MMEEHGTWMRPEGESKEGGCSAREECGRRLGEGKEMEDWQEQGGGGFAAETK